MLLTLLSTIVTVHLLPIAETKTIYVSQDGSDQNSCGNNFCGTLYMASTLTIQDEDRIVVNGQSEADINNIYNNGNDDYHPCLPKTFDATNVTTIEFNCSDMTCWYPSICTNIDKNSTTQYINDYMFEVKGGSLTITNLFIDHHKNNAPFGIMGITSLSRESEDNLSCFNCIFKNIINYNNDIHMIYSARNMKIINSSFVGIESISHFVLIGRGSTLVFENIMIDDSIFNESFTTILNNNRNTLFEKSQGGITLTNSQFRNIYSKTSLINDETSSSIVNVNQVNFSNINYGSIWRANYVYESEINMANIFISTSQLLRDNEYPLLSFNYAGHINIENMTVEYYYNIYENCYNVSNYINSSRLDLSYLLINCQNPVSLITNHETMVLNDIILSINISQNQIDAFKHDICPQCDIVQMQYSPEARDDALVSNYGTMTVNRLDIDGFSFRSRMFYNHCILNINNMQCSETVEPNALQSSHLIIQSGSTATFIAHDSIFVGGFTQIVSYSGSIQIYNSLFQNATQAILIQSGKDIVIYGSEFYHIGRYYGIFQTTLSDENEDTRPILKMKDMIGVNIEDNIFSDGFDDYGKWIFMDFWSSLAVIVKNNDLTMDDSNLYYKLPPNRDTKLPATLIYVDSSETSVIGNNFRKNDAYPWVPWIIYYSPNHINCLSANNFTNYAFRTLGGGTTITSCFRPDIINCFNKSNYCSDGVYGKMNKELNQQISHFNVLADFDQSIFYSWWDDTIALDNIQINVIGYNSNYSQKPFKTDHMGKLLILDSVLLPYDIDLWYYEGCNVSSNDRLINKTNYIAQAMIMCSWKHWGNPLIYLRNSSTLNFVDHFSATHVNFEAQSSSYYPGKKLTFDFNISDSLNNSIHKYNYSSEFMVNLIGNGDLGFLQNLSIKEYGDCDMCTSGMMIPTISLDHVKNWTYSHNNTESFHSLTASLPDNNLLLTNDFIPLQITACPKGMGPDSSEYLCDICDDGTYNLNEHNTRNCSSCNQERDRGIQCHGGNIYISKNYWSGVSNDNLTIVTEACPAKYCCINEQCNFENKSVLCTAGRDYETPLCGKCLDKYSQSMNSTKCTICNGNDYLWLVFPFALSLIITLYLISCHSKKNTTFLKKPQRSRPLEDSCCCIMLWNNKPYVLMVQTFGSRVLLYFFQAITQVLFPSTIAIWLYAIASAFDMTINLGDNGSEWCFIEGLTTKGKLLATGIPTLFIVAGLSVMCAWIWLLQRFGCEKEIVCCSKTIKCRPCNTNFAKAFAVMLLICVGQVLSILFKLLNCHQIGNVWVHFYFGEEECLETFTFYGALIGLGIVLVIFAIMFGKLYTMSDKQRNDPNQPLNSFCKYYKQKYYWWESIILLRRILIALLAMFYNNYYYITAVVIVLLCFLFFHTQARPFLSEQANTMESITLACLIIIITVQNTMHLYEIESVAEWILTYFVILPIVLIVAYIIIEACKVRYPRFRKVQNSHQNSNAPSISLHTANSLAKKSNDSCNIALNIKDVTDELSDDDKYENQNIQAKPYTIQLSNFKPDDDIEDEQSPLYRN